MDFAKWTKLVDDAMEEHELKCLETVNLMEALLATQSTEIIYTIIAIISHVRLIPLTEFAAVEDESARETLKTLEHLHSVAEEIQQQLSFVALTMQLCSFILRERKQNFAKLQN